MLIQVKDESTGTWVINPDCDLEDKWVFDHLHRIEDILEEPITYGPYLQNHVTMDVIHKEEYIPVCSICGQVLYEQ